MQNPGIAFMNYLLIPTVLLALGLFGLGVWLARRMRSKLHYCLWVVIAFLAAIPGVVFAAYYLKVFHEPIWLYAFRSWPFAELAASGAGFLAGFLHGRYSNEPRFRRLAGRWFFPGILLLGLLVPYAKPLLRPPRWTQFQDRWSEGVCLQTTESSCGPACAATLLRQFGKSATEADIARESFTSKSGTENWYLARALRHRGVQVRFRFAPGSGMPVSLPSIAGVRLPDFGNTGHFITILGQEDSKYVIGDPLEGRLKLSLGDVKTRYAFTGLIMQPTETNSLQRRGEPVPQ